MMSLIGSQKKINSKKPKRTGMLTFWSIDFEEEKNYFE